MFLTIISTVLLPLVITASLGYLLARRIGLNPRPIAATVFYLFNPCLVFGILSTSNVAPELLGRLVLLKLGTYAVMVPLARFVAGRLKLSTPAISAFIIAVIFANSGNYGLSVTEYAYGTSGLALAVICFVTDNLAVNSLGVFLAARGHASISKSVRSMFMNPALYALPLGILANQYQWTLPTGVQRAIDQLGRAAVPTMLVVLGMQLAAMPLGRHHFRAVGIASALKLLIAPLVGLMAASLLGMPKLGRQIGVLEVSTPTAVSASIVAQQYDAEPGLVAGTVLISSLASLATIAVILLLMA